MYLVQLDGVGVLPCGILTAVPKRNDASPDSAIDALQRCIQFGAKRVVLRDFPQGKSITLTPNASEVWILWAREGRGSVTFTGQSVEISPQCACLIADPQPVAVEWQSGARSLLVSVPRSRLQAAAYELFGDPRRVAPINGGLPIATIGADLFDCLVSVSQRAVAMGASTTELMESPPELCSAMVRGIIGAGLALSAFPSARAVKCAIDHIRAHHGKNCSMERLAAIAGVTAATLTKTFKLCVGMSIKEFLNEVRMTAARAALLSETDSRSIGDISKSVGVTHLSSFSRLYQQRFQEAPSQTRQANALVRRRQ